MHHDRLGQRVQQGGSTALAQRFSLEGPHARAIKVSRRCAQPRVGYSPNSLHWPSETTSTEPPSTLMAVCSSIAYERTPISAAHRSASAIVFVGNASRCGKIEKSTIPRVRSSGADGQWTKSLPIRGVKTILPALTPTHTVSPSDGSKSASPDSRI